MTHSLYLAEKGNAGFYTTRFGKRSGEELAAPVGLGDGDQDGYDKRQTAAVAVPLGGRPRPQMGTMVEGKSHSRLNIWVRSRQFSSH